MMMQYFPTVSPLTKWGEDAYYIGPSGDVFSGNVYYSYGRKIAGHKRR